MVFSEYIYYCYKYNQPYILILERYSAINEVHFEN